MMQGKYHRTQVHIDGHVYDDWRDWKGEPVLKFTGYGHEQELRDVVQYTSKFERLVIRKHMQRMIGKKTAQKFQQHFENCSNWFPYWEALCMCDHYGRQPMPDFESDDKMLKWCLTNLTFGARLPHVTLLEQKLRSVK